MRIDPHDIASRFDEDNQRHVCEYRTRTGNELSAWAPTCIWPEQGGAYVHIPNMYEESLMSYHIKQDYQYVGHDFWTWRAWIESDERSLDGIVTVE